VFFVPPSVSSPYRRTKADLGAFSRSRIAAGIKQFFGGFSFFLFSISRSKRLSPFEHAAFFIRPPARNCALLFSFHGCSRGAPPSVSLRIFSAKRLISRSISRVFRAAKQHSSCGVAKEVFPLFLLSFTPVLYPQRPFSFGASFV